VRNRCLMLQTRVPRRSDSRWLSQGQAEVRLDHRFMSPLLIDVLLTRIIMFMLVVSMDPE